MNPDELRRIAASLAKLAAEITESLDGPSTVKDRLEEFIRTGHVYRIPGAQVPFSQFYSKFKTWLPEHDRSRWTKADVWGSLPFDTSMGGRSNQPVKMVEDCSFRENETPSSRL